MSIGLCATAGRGQGVLNLYVDPNWGDDVQARVALVAALGAPGNPPDNVPTPFKTINGQDAWGKQRPLGAVPVLAVEGYRLIGKYSDVVVHLLPGLYGPEGTETCHAASGQRWNDDVFPIQMLDRISLQGTSALNTVLDARHVFDPAPAGPILMFEDTMPASYGNLGTPEFTRWHEFSGNPKQTHGRSFVNCVRLSGCTRPSGVFPGGQPAAAVFVRSESDPLSPQISNCFVADNNTGMLVLAKYLGGESYFVSHQPTLQNNNFVRNRVGFVDMDDHAVADTAGRSATIFLNNLFDNGNDDPEAGARWYDLMGVDGELLKTPFYRLGAAHPWSPWSQNGGYVNAFVSSRIRGGTLPMDAVPSFGTITGTQRRPGMTVPTLPAGSRIEFAPWTTLRTNGQYFVYNRLAPHDTYNPTSMRGAGDHDLRTTITPKHTGVAPAPPPGLIVTGNFYEAPLLDQGVDPRFQYRRSRWLHSSSGGGYTTEDLTLGPRIPGTPQSPPFGGWTFDCEGFGNPRTAIDQVFTPQRGLTATDIGADEIGELASVGFQPLSTQVHALRTLILPPPDPPVPNGTTCLMFLSAPGRQLQFTNWETRAAESFPDCRTAASQHIRAPEPLHLDTGPKRYVCYRVTYNGAYPGPGWNGLSFHKPSLLPDVDIAFNDAASVLAPTSIHVHPPGLRSDWDIASDETGDVAPAPVNALTGTQSCDANGLFLMVVPDHGPINVVRYNFVSRERNLQTLGLRSGS